MTPALHRLLPSLLPLFLLSSCEMQALVDYGDGTSELCPLSPLEVAPFLICCAGALLMLLHGFIPPVRRAYDALYRFTLRQFHIENKLEERTRLLTAYTVWLNVACGICLAPLCYALYEDTFFPFFGGPFNFGFTLAGLFFSALLSTIAFILLSLWAWSRWKRLSAI